MTKKMQMTLKKLINKDKNKLFFEKDTDFKHHLC